MASDSSSTYLLNHADLPSLYYQTNNENGGIIDLGLSLRVLQPETFTHPENPHVSDDYHDLLEWNQLHPSSESPNFGRNTFQSREQQSDFVKVNMDGVLIGRKICVLDHSGYLSLAYQLEDMFGRQSFGGLRLFESGSAFSLWYKDQDGRWKIAGDVPWKEFVDSVKRIRIILKEETLFRSMTTDH
ncbi:hypothetical protein OSB04_021475 [Centaurea solstitialis]|uniref:Auxin-responsive protein n=1 Tax=Centaurea solstitialis TaxID=347529 RepID=A0AA38W4Y8_9ASTR|nr:hypothetical protein OSB04_021475 [Centaurea solstitialis]